MGRMQTQGTKLESWINDLSTIEDKAVAGISALELDPYGTDFTRLRNAGEIGWVGNCFRVTLDEPFGRAKAGNQK
jgi:hypothetical protein